MRRIRFEAAEGIDAPAEVIWEILCDYRRGHPVILPEAHFGRLVVEEGGWGEGTVVRGTLRLFGRTMPFRHTVAVPEPGRVLVEADTHADTTTTFTLTPLAGGERTRVQIATELGAMRGPAGLVQRLLLPPVRGAMRRIYRNELENLAALAVFRSAAARRAANTPPPISLAAVESLQSLQSLGTEPPAAAPAAVPVVAPETATLGGDQSEAS